MTDDDVIVTPSGKIKLTREQFAQLNAAAEENKILHAKLNTFQGLLQSAMGNVNKVKNEIQTILREAVEVEVKL